MSETPSPSLSSTGENDLSGLKKMSTTAGLGNDEYAAVSPLAMASLLAGLIGFVAIFSEWLLVLPVAAIVCGVLGVRQVRRSDGTLTWGWAAWVGIILGILMIGIVGGGRILNEVRLRPDRTQIQNILTQLNKALETGDIESAYKLTGPRFQSRVSQATFVRNIKESEMTKLGKLVALEPNGQILFLNADGTVGTAAGTRIAIVGASPRYKNIAGTGTIEILVQKDEQDKWLIADIGFLFPKEK